MSTDELLPVHPGEILLEEFTEPLGSESERYGTGSGRFSATNQSDRQRAARHHRRYRRTPGSLFEMSPEFWMGVQNDCDLEKTEDELGDPLDREVKSKSEVLI